MKLLRAQVVLLSLLSLLSSFGARAGGWPELSGGPVTGGGERDAALVIGVDDYAYAPPVPGAEKNAEDWYRYLVKGLKVPTSSATLLRGREATLERIRRYAREMSAQVKPGGTLWFVFIGHGAPSQDGSEGVLVGHDAQQDVDGLYARSLGQRELTGLLSSGAPPKTVMVLDACFSGRTPSGEPLIEGVQPLIPLKTPEGTASNAWVLSAAKADQFAGALPGLRRPAFSYLVLGGIRGWAERDGDGFVSAGELLDYTADALRTLVRDRTQTPELQGVAEAPLVAAGGERAPDLAELTLSAPPIVTSAPSGAPPAATAPTVSAGGASARSIDVELVSADASARWDVYVDDEVVCTTPCVRKLDPLRPLLFRSRDDRKGPPDRIELAQLGGAAQPLMVQAHATSQGLQATGIVFTSLGGMAAVTGGALAAIGCSGRSAALCTGGLISAPIGLVTAAASIYLIVTSQPRAEIIPLHTGTLQVTGPSSVALAF